MMQPGKFAEDERDCASGVAAVNVAEINAMVGGARQRLDASVVDKDRGSVSRSRCI